jgi:PAS domain-containing protein
MDVRLGGEIDGVTLAEEIFVCEDTPVVFLSAYADQPTSVRAVQSGAYGYLTKPVIIQALISTVGLAIQKHKDLQRCRNDAQILSAAFDALPESVLIVNPQGVVLFLNQAAEALTGWKLHQTRATSPAWADELRRAGESELGRGTFISTLRHRTGERLPVSARAIPLRGADVMYVISPVASGGQGSN